MARDGYNIWFWFTNFFDAFRAVVLIWNKSDEGLECWYERLGGHRAIDRIASGIRSKNLYNLSTFYIKRSNKNHLRESKAIYQAILSVDYYNFCSAHWFCIVTYSHNTKKKLSFIHSNTSCNSTRFSNMLAIILL